MPVIPNPAPPPATATTTPGDAPAATPVRLGATSVMSLDGPAIGLIVGETVLLVGIEDAKGFARRILQEAHRGEGFALMAAAMEDAKLSHKTIYRVLTAATHGNTRRGRR